MAILDNLHYGTETVTYGGRTDEFKDALEASRERLTDILGRVEEILGYPIEIEDSMLSTRFAIFRKHALDVLGSDRADVQGSSDESIDGVILDAQYRAWRDLNSNNG